jgi:RND family efflux transporter MFP subunit
MKVLPWLVTALALLALVVSRWGAPSSPSAPHAMKEAAPQGLLAKVAAHPARQEATSAPGSAVFEVKGRTQCVPNRKALIAPVPLHPVVSVLVVPGQQVKKDQVLIKIDDDEAQADVRAKTAALESARITVKECQRLLPKMRDLYVNGFLPEATYHRIKMDSDKASQDERAALAALEASKAELEHYTVTSQIEGVVSWLDVHVGMVSRPGTTVWGEILDLSEMDARCELTPDQADRVAVGQAAEVRKIGKKGVGWMAKVVFVALAADKRSGRVPVNVRLSNAKASLRCEVPVEVRFTEALAGNDTAK